MKIAVTSASGNLGASIVHHLINEVGKENVIGIARTPEKAAHLGVEIREGDYNNKAHFDKALREVDVLLLVSGMADPIKRIEQHRNVIAAAKDNGVQKIVYTSIVGAEENNAFSPIVQSNRQTEKDVSDSGLDWVIGRNGIYIEPDLEYIDTYVAEGGIRNCAGDGKCTYTNRDELGYAYAKMLIKAQHNNQIYNLVGEGITQTQLSEYLNQVYNTELGYEYISVDQFAKERKEALGDFIGSVIAGIYEGIKDGANDVSSDYKKATGRNHKSTLEMIKMFKNN